MCGLLAGGRPIQTEEMHYGLQIKVLVLPAHPLLTTPEALKFVGPDAFGYKHVYTPSCPFVTTTPIPGEQKH